MSAVGEHDVVGVGGVQRHVHRVGGAVGIGVFGGVIVDAGCGAVANGTRAVIDGDFLCLAVVAEVAGNVADVGIVDDAATHGVGFDGVFIQGFIAIGLAVGTGGIDADAGHVRAGFEGAGFTRLQCHQGIGVAGVARGIAAAGSEGEGLGTVRVVGDVVVLASAGTGLYHLAAVRCDAGAGVSGTRGGR